MATSGAFPFSNAPRQPAGFWHNPEHATRFDGLSIYDDTNSKFEFFLGHGWAPYVMAVRFILPRRLQSSLWIIYSRAARSKRGLWRIRICFLLISMIPAFLSSPRAAVADSR